MYGRWSFHVAARTLKAWRHKNKPSLGSIEAVLGFLGWDFVPVPRGRNLPPEVVRFLRPTADAAGLTIPGAVQALVEIVTDIHVDLKGARAPKPKLAPSKRLRDDAHPDQTGLFADPLTVH